MQLTRRASTEPGQSLPPRVLLTELTRWALAAVAGFGLVCLVTAMLGFFRPIVVIVLSIAATVVTARLLPRSSSEPGTVPAQIALGLVIMASLTLGVTTPHEHILATRDSGNYVATATWIANRGGVQMDVGSPVFDGLPVTYESLGFPAGSQPTRLQPQFMHTFPGLMALVSSIGGLGWAYVVAPVLTAVGLLCLFALARRFLTPWWAVLAVTLTAASMPFVYFGRAPFSESLAFVLIVGGLWTATEALEQRSMSIATGAGLLLGGVTLARIDGIVVLLGLVVCRTLVLLTPTPTERESETQGLVDRMIAAALAPFALALADLLLFSRQYLVDHGSLIAAVLATTFGLFIVGRFAPSASDWFLSHRRAIGTVVSSGVGAYLLYAWLVRPYVESPTRSDIYGIEGLQAAAGVPVEPLRSYAELSVHWLTWYLGVPLVALAIAGLVIFMRRLVVTDVRWAGPFTCVVSVLTLLYVYRPSINPDHIWAMRRFVPLVIPGLAVLGVAMAGEVARRVGRWATPVSVVLASMLMVPVLVPTVEAGLNPEFGGASADVSEVCRTLGPDAAVLFVGDSADTRLDALGPLLRGACAVPVALWADSSLEPAMLDAFREQAAGNDTTPWLLGISGATDQEIALFDESYPYLEISLFERPTDWQTLPIRIVATRLQ